jgi:hypothetical protein
MLNVNKQNHNKIIAYLLLTITTTFLSYQKFISNLDTIDTIDTIDTVKELYDTKLNRIQNIDDLDHEVKTRVKNDFSDTSKVVNTIDDILRSRFYHGYSEYSMRDNWVAYLCSEILFWGIKHPVIPDDILKYPMAACSQQGLVFQAILRQYDIPYATIAFGQSDKSYSGHYAVSAYYGNSWHYFDSNQEPIKLKGSPSIENLIKKKQLVKIYKGNAHVTAQWLNDKVENNTIYRINENVESGQKMQLVQNVTHFLSTWSWFICVGLCFYVTIMARQRKIPELNEIRTTNKFVEMSDKAHSF